MSPIAVRYNLFFGILMIVVGSFILLTALVTQAGMLFLLGPLNLVIGVLYLTKPWFVVHDDRVELKNLWGWTMKTHDVPSSELEIRDRKLYKRGTPKALCGGFLARSEDIDGLAKALGS